MREMITERRKGKNERNSVYACVKHAQCVATYELNFYTNSTNYAVISFYYDLRTRMSKKTVSLFKNKWL